MTLEEKYLKDWADYRAANRRIFFEDLLVPTAVALIMIAMILFPLFALFGCSAQPCTPVLVKVPVAACPVPAAIPPPHEWLYDLSPDASPDAVSKYTQATIKELEAGIIERDKVLETYRHQ